MKFKYIHLYITSIALISILFSEVGYNTIYLMEFENQQNEFTNSHLAQALPDLIKQNYEFRQDIRVEYAGDIRPYLEKNGLNDKESIKGLIINGRYLTINNEFFVEFEAYDIHNWKLLVRRQLFCPVQDLICVHDGFIMAIEKTISPFLNDALNIDETITALEQSPKTRTPGYDLESDKNVKLDSLINLDDYTGQVVEPGRKQGQYGDRYYREFTFKNIPPDPKDIKKQNTEKLITIIDRIIDNPYDVLIGDLTLIHDYNKPTNLKVSLPIEYSVRSSLAQDLLNSLPHEKNMDENGNIILQFPNNNFIFDDGLLEKFALMKFQLMPVIFFHNRIGAIQFIILDSWDKEYNQLEFEDVIVMKDNQFRPLFALTPGVDNIQLDLDVSTLRTLYDFSIPRELLGEYTKVAVKFMKEEELRNLLIQQSTNNKYLYKQE